MDGDGVSARELSRPLFWAAFITITVTTTVMAIPITGTTGQCTARIILGFIIGPVGITVTIMAMVISIIMATSVAIGDGSEWTDSFHRGLEADDKH